MNSVILVMKLLILCLYVVTHAEGECVKHGREGEEKEISFQSLEIHESGSMPEPHKVPMSNYYLPSHSHTLFS